MQHIKLNARNVGRNNNLYHPDAVIIDACSDKTKRWCRIFLDPLMGDISLEDAVKERMPQIKKALRKRR